MDQSTCARRHALCEREFELNRRTAPQLYLNVVAVRRSNNGEFSLDGDGDVVDWLVEMRRFEDENLLDAVARRGELTPELAGSAARALAVLHHSAPESHQMGHAADYRRTIKGLRQTEEDAVQDLGMTAAAASSELLDALDAELSHIDPLIEARRRGGKVRRGHGDAHLQNIMLWDGAPTFFDALEFDERMATTDVVYDFAFLAMDLLHRDLRASANTAMNAWWDAFEEDEAALAALPFFMSLRAAVKMAVATAGGSYETAQSYRTLAGDLLHGEAPALIAVGGLSGVGKSTIARQLAKALPGPCGARILRTDVLRKRGGDLTAAAPSEAYSDAGRRSVYEQLYMHAFSAVGAGTSVLADATFKEAEFRSAIASAAGEHPFIGLWLHADLNTRLERIGGRKKGASDADENVARAQAEPDIIEPGWITIDASGEIEETMTGLRRALSERGVGLIGNASGSA